MTINTPVTGYHDLVRPDWTDYSGHMDIDSAAAPSKRRHAPSSFGHLGTSRYCRERSNHSLLAFQSHTVFKRNLLAGQALRFVAQILTFTGKRSDGFYRMLNVEKGYLAATNETLYVHVDLDARRTAPVPPKRDERLPSVVARHLALPRPPNAGRGIGPHRSAVRSQGASEPHSTGWAKTIID